MKKEYEEVHRAKMLSVQRVLFRAFVINFALVFAVWLLTFWPTFMYLLVGITGVSLPTMYISVIGCLAIWKLAGVVLFLVPAVAIWWERSVMK